MRVVVAALWCGLLGAALSDDSLRGALQAVQRRQRDLTPPAFYSSSYLLGDGQPEDIGYGYQKSLAPNTAGVFEPLALPSTELGNHDMEDKAAEVKVLEELMFDYLEDPDNFDSSREYLRRYNAAAKRSIFRERDDSEFPEALQRLYETEDIGKPEEETPIFLPSPFRERLADTRKARLQNAHALVRSFAGLNRGFEDPREDSEDNDEYLNILNSVWEKYKGEEDPEEITESDVEELLEYLNAKEEKKRQYGGSYSAGYDFFNSPLGWAKRNGKKNPLDMLRTDGDDIGRMVMTVPSEPHRKNYLQDIVFDERYPYRGIQKRFPITKRSPAYYVNPAPLHHADGQRRKKNKGSIKPETDPKVAEELNNIFSADKKTPVPKPSRNESAHIKLADVKNATGKLGQKEVDSDNASTKPLEVKKKSIDWSEYFGYDRRKKSKRNEMSSDEWLLNQYLKAYNLGKQREESAETTGTDNPVLNSVYDQKKKPDDMDSKLRAMEDLIVDQAIKYTGAHEGSTDIKEVQEVKDKVMGQLAAAYSLEKMRRALGEFKSSIEAQRATVPAFHSIPPTKVDQQEHKAKRIAVKKEKVDLAPAEGKVEKKDVMENRNRELDEYLESIAREVSECTFIKELDLRCKKAEDMAGGRFEFGAPCTFYHVCYLCGGGSARGCDGKFLLQSRSSCREDEECFQAARRTLAHLRAARLPGDRICPTCLVKLLSRR